MVYMTLLWYPILKIARCMIKIISICSKTKRRLHLIEKETRPREMFNCFKELLESFPSHRFWTTWQNDQMKNLVANLLLRHVSAVHDYSENYICQLQDQLQTSYFLQAQASIHVTVLYRHALKQTQSEECTEESPVVITEHTFVVSPGYKHNNH